MKAILLFFVQVEKIIRLEYYEEIEGARVHIMS